MISVSFPSLLTFVKFPRKITHVTHSWPSFAASLLVKGEVTCVLTDKNTSMRVRIILKVQFEQNVGTTVEKRVAFWVRAQPILWGLQVELLLSHQYPKGVQMDSTKCSEDADDPKSHALSLLGPMKRTKLTPLLSLLKMKLNSYWALPLNWLWEQSRASHKYPGLGQRAGQALTETGIYQDMKYLSGKSLEGLKLLCYVPSWHAKVNWASGRISTAWQQNWSMAPKGSPLQGLGDWKFIHSSKDLWAHIKITSGTFSLKYTSLWICFVGSFRGCFHTFCLKFR